MPPANKLTEKEHRDRMKLVDDLVDKEGISRAKAFDKAGVAMSAYYQSKKILGLTKSHQPKEASATNGTNGTVHEEAPKKFPKNAIMPGTVNFCPCCGTHIGALVIAMSRIR